MSGKQMFPALAPDDQPDRWTAHVELFREDSLQVAPGVSLANRNNVGVCEFSQAVGRSLVDRLAKNVEFVMLVLAPGYKFKVARAVVGFVSILVVVLVAGWAWADECLSNQGVHQHALALPVTPQVGAEVLLRSAAQLCNDFAALNASNAARVANFVVESFDLSPFHALSISHATYGGKS